jgi:hypothetical protein
VAQICPKLQGKKIQKNRKKVLHLLSGLDTTAENQAIAGAKKFKKTEKKYCIFFTALIQAHQSKV